MNNYEKLLQEGQLENIKIFENYNFKSDCKGMAVGSNIALSGVIRTSIERTCILAEELGHYHTTVGDILDLSDVNNRKQEYHARLWAYNKLIGLYGIIQCYKASCHTLFEMADYLNVTEEFLQETLSCYKQKYGVCAKLDNYVIYFEPNIFVLELI